MYCISLIHVRMYNVIESTAQSECVHSVHEQAHTYIRTYSIYIYTYVHIVRAYIHMYVHTYHIRVCKCSMWGEDTSRAQVSTYIRMYIYMYSTYCTE